jgi:hypothetical protein
MPKVMTSLEMDHAPYRLAEEIVTLSVGDCWDDAKLEWDLAQILR